MRSGGNVKAGFHFYLGIQMGPWRTFVEIGGEKEKLKTENQS